MLEPAVQMLSGLSSSHSIFQHCIFLRINIKTSSNQIIPSLRCLFLVCPTKDQDFLSHVLHSLCFFSLRLQSGVNLQVCFVNDSSSDKDSDAEDSRTETSLDTPLSPVVCTASVVCVFVYVLVCVFLSHPTTLITLT